MAGALLILIGAVALVDRLLPGAERALVTFPVGVQLVLGGAAVAIGAALFLLGRRWRGA